MLFPPRLPTRVQVFAVDGSDPDAVKPRLAPVQHVSTLPPAGYEGVNYVGEIKIDAEGRFLYVSNRGHDSVAVFKVDQVC